MTIPTDRTDTTPDTRLAVRPAEAARILGIGTRKLWELTNRGEIPAGKIGRAVVYRIADLDAWLAAQISKGVR